MAKFSITQYATTERTVVIEAASEDDALAVFERGAVVETNKGHYFSFDKSGMGPGEWFGTEVEDTDSEPTVVRVAEAIRDAHDLDLGWNTFEQERIAELETILAATSDAEQRALLEPVVKRARETVQGVSKYGTWREAQLAEALEVATDEKEKLRLSALLRVERERTGRAAVA